MAIEYYISEEDLQERFDEMMDLVETIGAHIFITRDGKAQAVIIPYVTYQYYQSIIDGEGDA